MISNNKWILKHFTTLLQSEGLDTSFVLIANHSKIKKTINFGFQSFLSKQIYRSLFFFITLAFILSGCTAKKFIPKDKILLHKNIISIDTKQTTFAKSDIAILAAQKPNKHILGMRFRLWAYYFSEPRTEKKFWKWVNTKVAKPPVYYDALLTKTASQQMSRYLHNVGYFNNKVEFELINNKHVKYLISPSLPYRIDSISYSIPDTLLATFVKEVGSESLIKSGKVYNAYTLDDERDRITTHLKNNGYYFFTKDYILFEVDSNLQNNLININQRIENPKSNSFSLGSQSSDKLHQRYFINQVKLFPTYNPFVNTNTPFDTTVLLVKREDKKEKSVLYLYSQGDPRIKPGTFSQVVQIYENEAFSIKKLRQTYKGLTNLKLYRASNITFDTAVNRITSIHDPGNWIDCNIYLQRNKVHAYSIEMEGTNSGGDLGIRGSLIYSNTNLFRGAEVLRIRLNGGIEAQRLSAVSLDNPELAGSIFNTTEAGIDANIYFPRFLSPIRLRNFIYDYQPKTNLNIGFSSQNRINYQRYLIKGAFGYDWMTSNTVNHILTPISLNSVKVNPSAAFQKILDQEINQRYKDQYSDHLIFSARYSFIYNNQNINKLNDFFYYRINVESSGNLVSLINNTSLLKNNGEYYELFGIRYAQFFRVDQDFRYYHVINQNNTLVFRAVFGAGIPFGNSSDLPFERSFYSGGANGMRGWQYRQLGPGSFSDSINIERIGDLQLEFNAEYRFPIYGYLQGALFADAGNIWTLQEKPYLKDGVFKIDQFYNDIAIDAGFGLRLDFSFFIFRLDAAVPIHDPEKPLNERWQFNNIKLKRFIWNFGIGYPF